jgi:hypothetical protein
MTSDTAKSRRLPAALSAALAIVLYAHTLGGTWIYDDRFHAHDDPRLGDVAAWREYLTDGYVPGAADHLWRPLVSLSYAVQWRLTGDQAWPFHLVNVLLHAAASALVAELARRLTASATVALAAGLAFAAHPVHVEGVAYIVGRAESACAVGTLGALVLMCAPLTSRRALAILACVLVAVLSKEQGLLVPPMLLGLWWLRHAHHPASPEETKAARLLLILILFALPTYIIYREHILPWYWEVKQLDYATQPMIRSAARDRALIPFALFGRAAALLVLPLKLSPEYGASVITARQSLTDPYLYVGLLGVVAAIALTCILIRRRAWTALWLIACATLTYGMVANVKLIGVVFAERLLYLPSAFLLILAAIPFARLPTRPRTAVALLLLLTWSTRTVTYAARWNDRLTFYEASVRDHPQAARLRVLLAREYLDRNQLDRARAVIEPALAITPEYWKLWAMAARIAARQDRYADAQAYLDRAWTLDPFVLDLLDVQTLLQARQATTRP